MCQQQEFILDRKSSEPALQEKWVHQRIFITNAQGFIERYLIGCVLQQYPQITVLGVGRSRQQQHFFSHTVSRDGIQVQAPLPSALSTIDLCPNYSYRPVDIQDKGSLRSILFEFQPDLVIHLGTSSPGSRSADGFSNTALMNTVNAAIVLLEAIAECQLSPTKILLGSTSAVYGTPATVPIPEDAPLVPIDLYGASARATEEMTRLFAALHHLPVVWARLFQVMGPGQSEDSIIGALLQQAMAPDATLAALPAASIPATQDLIDVRDVVKALLLLAKDGQDGQIYNVGSGQEASIEQTFQQALSLKQLNQKDVASTYAITPSGEIERSGFTSRICAEISRLSQLGFSPQYSLQQSLNDILDYYNNLNSVSLNGAANPQIGQDESVPLLPLNVQVEETHTYPVLVSTGLLDELPSHITRLFPDSKVVILTDERVQQLYGEKLLQRFIKAGISANMVLLAEGESAKRMESYHTLIQELYRLQFDRRAVLVCLGGGVVSDVGGFVAATYMRGVAYVNVPTTLLAQNDAAIGGKVAVNMPWAKNFVGAFHHPKAVFCDPQVLASQDERNLAAGIAESIKVAICGNPDLFTLLEQNAQQVLKDRNPSVLGQIVHASAHRKIVLLHPDPYEVDLRRVLNLGHSFGHALEVEMEFEGLLHGEAVAWGLVVATTISVMRGICSKLDADRIYALLLSYGLPPRLKKERLHQTCQRLQEIRLVRGQRLHFVLPTSISTVQIVPELEEGEIDRALEIIANHPLLKPLILREASFYSSASQSSKTLEYSNRVSSTQVSHHSF